MATESLDPRRVDEDSWLWPVVLFNAVFALQLLGAGVYTAVFGGSRLSLHLFVIPFVWITVSIVAVWFTRPASRELKYHLFAGGVAAAYFLLFLVLSGSLGRSPELFDPITGPLGVGVEASRSLGWGPVVYYSGQWIGIRLIPFQFIGYLALSYLVYVAILDATRAASAGTIGLILCPGCAAAVFAPVFAGVAGVSSALSVFIRFNYEIATVLFLVAMGVLYWRPSIDRTRTFVGERFVEMTGAVAGAVALLHLLNPENGLPRLVLYLQVGIGNEHVPLLPDPRPLAFTLAAVAMLAGMALAYHNIARKPLYLAGIGLMLVFLFGYGAWHTVLDHGAFWPHIHGHGHHEQSALVTVWEHLINDGYALASKAAELLLLAMLVLCYKKE